MGTNALEGKGPRRRPQKQLDRRLEEVAKAVGVGYCRLQMPLKPALAVKKTAAGQRESAEDRRGEAEQSRSRVFSSGGRGGRGG